MPRRAAPLVAPLVALLLLAAACGSSKTSTGASSTTTAAPSSGGPAATGAPAAIPAADRSAPGTWGKEPTVKVPSGPPPTSLETADLITGTGPAARAGDQVTVQYVGVSYTTKKIFDASWNRGQTFPFTLGAGQVIPGWDQGVAGMKAGGRRELIIPPGLAYRDQPPPGSGIPANDTLIFVVDLVQIG